MMLAFPGLVVLPGVVPDPVAVDNVYLTAVTVGWLGCALPSPQDFSVFWNADRVVDRVVHGRL